MRNLIGRFIFLGSQITKLASLIAKLDSLITKLAMFNSSFDLRNFFSPVKLRIEKKIPSQITKWKNFPQSNYETRQSQFLIWLASFVIWLSSFSFDWRVGESDCLIKIGYIMIPI